MDILIDRDEFIDFVADREYEYYADEIFNSHTLNDMDEVHDSGLTFELTQNVTIEDVGDFEYWAIYNVFLNKNQDIVDIINDGIEQLIDDNYDYKADDVRTIMKLRFG